MGNVADCTGRIGSIGNESERGRLEVKMHCRAALLVATLIFGTVPALSAVTEYVVPTGPLITLQDGQTIDGHIVKIDQTNIVIQTADGATQSLPRSTVQAIAFETVTGRKLTGELVGWTSGVYQITTPEAAIKVYSTMPATTSPAEPLTVADGEERKAVDAGAPEIESAAYGGHQREEVLDLVQSLHGRRRIVDSG